MSTRVLGSFRRSCVSAVAACVLAAAAAAAIMAGCERAESRAAPGNGGAAGAAPTAADLAAGKLAGLYVRQKMVPMSFGGRMTFNLQREFFYFFPDGHVLFGLPPEIKEYPAAADFAALKDAPPEQRGTYAVADGRITFNPDKGKAYAEPFSIPKAGDDGVLQIGEASVVGSVKAVPFKDGQKLDGAYQFDGTIGLGGPNTIFNVQTLTFRPDGTLGSAKLTGVDTRGVDTKVGNSGVTAHDDATATGTYEFGGYTLTTTVGGKAQKATAFRWAGDDKDAAPGMICVNGRVYSRHEPRK